MLTSTINAVMALFLSGALYLVQVQNNQNEHSMWKTIETKPFVCASYETTSLNLHWQMSNQYDYRWLWCVCVWVLFVFLHLISVTLVLRLILWWFCDRIYKCGVFFVPAGEGISCEESGGSGAVVLQTVTAVMMVENMRVHFYCVPWREERCYHNANESCCWWLRKVLMWLVRVENSSQSNLTSVCWLPFECGTIFKSIVLSPALHAL